MIVRKVKRNCLICGNNWIGKNNDNYPHCPRCGTSLWDKGNNIQCGKGISSKNLTSKYKKY